MNSLESELAIIAACDKRYEYYIPLFILAATQAYPEATVYVFLSGEADIHTRFLLKQIKGNFHFYDKQFQHEVKSIFGAKAMRWLVYLNEFSKHKYIYIGDIDLMICYESLGIVAPHLAHCNHLGLPYSTKMRAHQNRVSALVFAYRQEWYDAMLPVINEFAPDVWAGKYDELKSDEKLLYEMISNSSLPLPPTVEERDDVFTRYHPHHGLHLSIFRDEMRLKYRLGQPSYRFLKTHYPRYWESFQKRVSTHPCYLDALKMGDLGLSLSRIYELMT